MGLRLGGTSHINQGKCSNRQIKVTQAYLLPRCYQGCLVAPCALLELALLAMRWLLRVLSGTHHGVWSLARPSAPQFTLRITICLTRHRAQAAQGALRCL